MKTLLFINGTEGSQIGIEDGFNYLHGEGKISDLNYFYFEAFANKNSFSQSMVQMQTIANEFQPDLIIFFHISKFPIKIDLILEIKAIRSKPIIAYDEGDMYGGLAKPITKSMKCLIKYSDFVSIRGFGTFYNAIHKLNSNIVFTPNSNWLLRYTNGISINENKTNKIVFIGNRITSRLGLLKRLPGAYQREKLLKKVSSVFNKDFSIYGSGWGDFDSNKGKLNYYEQTNICNGNWIQLTYEHYPKIPYFFSDRIPIALSCGQIIVTNYKEGYETLFKNADFIYFYRSTNEAIEILFFLRSLNKEQLLIKSKNAKRWADNNLNPQIIWGNLVERIYINSSWEKSIEK